VVAEGHGNPGAPGPLEAERRLDVREDDPDRAAQLAPILFMMKAP
jgi:hypothetical protein